MRVKSRFPREPQPCCIEGVEMLTAVDAQAVFLFFWRAIRIRSGLVEIALDASNCNLAHVWLAAHDALTRFGYLNALQRLEKRMH
jgi:hypothetical protein